MTLRKLKPLISLTPAGLFCEEGGFYIDPSRAVSHALITHAHSDHARRGSARYTCHTHSIGLLRQRLGASIQVESVEYGRKFQLGSVTVSFHSAGHILGSAQVRVESATGEVWVASGDYKRDQDPTCPPFEIVGCDTFITEATFGLPMYQWGDTSQLGREIHDWWHRNGTEGRNSLLFCYSLGKAQRILAELAPHTDRRVLIHSTIGPLTECYREAGVKMVPTLELRDLAPEAPLSGELILIPPGSAAPDLVENFGEFATAFASGWGRGRSNRGGAAAARGEFPLRSGSDRSFIMSDHADWPALLRTIEETGARRVFVAHREDGVLAKYLRDRGWVAGSVNLLADEIDELPPAGLEKPGLLRRPGARRKSAVDASGVPLQSEFRF